MKKIWSWIGLLLLLMILCVVTKVDTIHITKKLSEPASTKQTLQSSSQPIDFDIVQHGKAYSLRGRFKDTGQQERLVNAFKEAQRTLTPGNIATSQTLGAGSVIVLVEKIVPHFVKNYQDGTIQFHNNKLTIDGTVGSYAAKREMQHLLSGTTIPTEDRSVVSKPQHVLFKIEKEDDAMVIHGSFHGEKQLKSLAETAPQGMQFGRIDKRETYTDPEGAIPFAQRILPLFSEKFTQGFIQYYHDTFVVNGLAKDRAGLETMKSLLAQSRLKVIDQTKLDPEVLRAEAEAKAARLKAAEEAKAAAEAARLKAEEEARIAAEKEEEERRKAEEEARIAAARAEAEEAKKSIAKVLTIENIEFDVAKGTLTPKGHQTVNKLANILKQYPHIRVEIAGHTDSDGDAAFNLNLSQARVDSVKKALVDQGIDPSRLDAKGYGESKPLAPNTTAENKQKNRRVEFNIIGE